MYRHTNEKKKFVISRNQKYTYPLGSAAKNQWIKKKRRETYVQRWPYNIINEGNV